MVKRLSSIIAGLVQGSKVLRFPIDLSQALTQALLGCIAYYCLVFSFYICPVIFACHEFFL